MIGTRININLKVCKREHIDTLSRFNDCKDEEGELSMKMGSGLK